MLDIKQYPQYLHDACKYCISQNCAKANKYDGTELLFKEDDFVISCFGIANDWGNFIRNEVLGPGEFDLLSPEEREELINVYDIAHWAKHNLMPEKGGWDPRGATDSNMLKYKLDYEANKYQWLLLNCTANRCVARIGRRAGKTESLSIRLLHALTFNDGYRVLLACPFKSQVEIVFKRIEDLARQSPKLQGSIKHAKYNPYPEITFHNGSVLIGFTSGAKSGSNADTARGQGADLLIFDEADYLNPKDMASLAGILMDSSTVKLWASSTPTGKRERFYQWCHIPSYRQFHYPSMCNPNWSRDMEIEMKDQFTEAEYEHEVRANFGEAGAGVFQKAYIDLALRDYRYEFQQREPNWCYMIGVDWNPVIGTEIYVIGAREEESEEGAKTLFRAVDVGQVPLIGWTEIKSVSEIVRLYRKWTPDAIYIDNGGGGHMAVQLLHQIGTVGLTKKEHPADAYLLKVVKGLDMGGSVETNDPWTKEKVKRPLKPFTISNTVRQFEQCRIELSQHDKLLVRQLEGYTIDRVNQSGQPVFVPADDKVGDHKLDALTFALLAFTMEKTQTGRLAYSDNLGIVGESLISGKGPDKDDERQALKRVIAEARTAALKRRSTTTRSSEIEKPMFAPRPDDIQPGSEVRAVSWAGSRHFDRTGGVGVKSEYSGRSKI